MSSHCTRTISSLSRAAVHSLDIRYGFDPAPNHENLMHRRMFIINTIVRRESSSSGGAYLFFSPLRRRSHHRGAVPQRRRVNRGRGDHRAMSAVSRSVCNGVRERSFLLLQTTEPDRVVIARRDCRGSARATSDYSIAPRRCPRRGCLQVPSTLHPRAADVVFVYSIVGPGRLYERAYRARHQPPHTAPSASCEVCAADFVAADKTIASVGMTDGRTAATIPRGDKAADRSHGHRLYACGRPGGGKISFVVGGGGGRSLAVGGIRHDIRQ